MELLSGHNSYVQIFFNIMNVKKETSFNFTVPHPRYFQTSPSLHTMIFTVLGILRSVTLKCQSLLLFFNNSSCNEYIFKSTLTSSNLIVTLVTQESEKISASDGITAAHGFNDL